MEHVLSIVARCLIHWFYTNKIEQIYGTFGTLNEDYDMNDNLYYLI